MVSEVASPLTVIGSEESSEPGSRPDGEVEAISADAQLTAPA